MVLKIFKFELNFRQFCLPSIFDENAPRPHTLVLRMGYRNITVAESNRYAVRLRALRLTAINRSFGCSAMPTRPAQPRPPAIERLAEMLAVHRQLNAEKVAVENAARLLEDPMLQRLSRRQAARVAADIDMLDRHLIKIVESDAGLAHRYRLLWPARWWRCCPNSAQ